MNERDDTDLNLPQQAIPFAKMSGSGNDFIVIDNRMSLIAADVLPEFTRRLCQRGIGLGADGIVTIEPVTEADGDVDFRWRYVNADGSDGELCGNGAMCGARFAVQRGIAPRSCLFATPSGHVHADVDPDGSAVRIAIADAGLLAPPVAITVGGHDLAFYAIRVGVPHVVAFVPDADAFADAATFARIGSIVRHHPAFAPEGTNVNFVHQLDAQTLRMRTYERGVEAETLACGTGSVASAIVGTRILGMTPPVTVMVSSGMPLRVSFQWDEDAGVARQIGLQGDARVVARGELDPEGWLR